MFSGIVEEIGIITGINKTLTGICVKIKANAIISDVKLGDSIAVNGICLSVTDIKKDILSFDVMPQTLKETNLGESKVNYEVNLERSLRADSRIDGHFVSGHIDCKGKIEKVIKGHEGYGFKISVPNEFFKFIAEKGSIAIDGVSLTVAEVTNTIFTAYLIPHTLKVTTLGRKKKGDLLNVETDLLAKYLSKQNPKTNLRDILKKYEYI